ncbi:hypothetical protein LV779_14855 [Streptomyces thinghirensis]|nr:hypothetical protein [Streptomyces thinghirensis]
MPTRAPRASSRTATCTTPLSSRRAGEAGSRTPPCGSCGRPGAHCRSTARCARAIPMFESCTRPELVTEITPPAGCAGTRAWTRPSTSSDIVVPLKAIGIDLDIKPGVGPSSSRKPIRARARPAHSCDHPRGRLHHVTGGLRSAHPGVGRHPLIGFAGAPFTLASYPEGNGLHHEYTKASRW